MHKIKFLVLYKNYGKIFLKSKLMLDSFLLFFYIDFMQRRQSILPKKIAEDFMKVILSIDGLSYLDVDWKYMPTLKSIADEHNYCKKVRVHFPSVTWHMHSTFFTGKNLHEHKVFGNTYLNKEKEICHYWDASTKKEETIAVETLYDNFKKDNKTIASVCLPLTQGAKSIDYNIPEFYTQEEFDKHCTKDFYNELIDAGLPIHRYGKWSKEVDLCPLQDELTQNIMEYIIKNKQVDLLMGHYLLIDSFQHEYGCNSAEKIFAMKYVDNLIARLICCLKENNYWEDIELLIFSDHGLSDITHSFDIDEALEKAGFSASINYTDDGGALHFYLENINISQAFEDFLSSIDCIEKFIKLEKEQNLERKPDYQISFKEGYVTKQYFLEHKEGATHGYDPLLCDRMNSFALFINKEKSSEIIEEIDMTELYSYTTNNKQGF